VLRGRALSETVEGHLWGDGVRIPIVGAAIAGLAAARALRSWGRAVEIVERARRRCAT
jgi:monoamine oxidase